MISGLNSMRLFLLHRGFYLREGKVRILCGLARMISERARERGKLLFPIVALSSDNSIEGVVLYD